VKIQIEKYRTRETGVMYRADCLDLPGSPPCGDGKTKEIAMANLFLAITAGDRSDWLQYVKRGSVEIVYK
jgi:hypothetical protein